MHIIGNNRTLSPSNAWLTPFLMYIPNRRQPECFSFAGLTSFLLFFLYKSNKNIFIILLELPQLNLCRLTSKRTFSQCCSLLWKMHLRSRRIKMAEKTDSSSVFESPNSSLSYDNQQYEDPVSHLMQRISKLG